VNLVPIWICLYRVVEATTSLTQGGSTNPSIHLLTHQMGRSATTCTRWPPTWGAFKPPQDWWHGASWRIPSPHQTLIRPMPSRTALGALVAGRKSASLRCRTTQLLQWPSCVPCSRKWPCLPLCLQELEISVAQYGHGSPKRACLPVPANVGITKLPLFAHSQPPMRMGRPAASLSATAL